MTTSQIDSPSPLKAGSRREHAQAVREMFSAIAPRYDLLNHLLSLNIDRSWRRKAVKRLGWERSPGGLYLDACTGTYDLAIEIARCRGFAGKVVAADFAGAMLHQGRRKIARQPVIPVCADSLTLPFAARTVDGAVVGFGVRNLADIDAGLSELRRVLRPGGRVVILDFATPVRQPLRGIYLLYFTRVLPFLGRLISKHSYAYKYLPDSVMRFAAPEQVGERLESAGFTDVEWVGLTGGIACLWWGCRPR